MPERRALLLEDDVGRWRRAEGPELTADGGRGVPHEEPARPDRTRQPVRQHVQSHHRRLVEVPIGPVRAGAEAHREAVSALPPVELSRFAAA